MSVTGHEWCGVVEEVGPACEVEGLSVGDHVVGEGIVPCRACQHCQQGASNICDSYNEIGYARGYRWMMLQASRSLTQRLI